MTVAESRLQTQPQVEIGRCQHCRTPLRAGDVDFCCKGCAFVYATINGLGLTAFYSLQRGSGEYGVKAESQKSYAYLLEPALLAQISEQFEDTVLKLRFYLPTVHCAACVWILEKLPEVVSGVLSSRVSFASGSIEITIDTDLLSVDKAALLLHSIGYPPVPAIDDAIKKRDRSEQISMLMRIGVTALCAANTMMLADSLFQSAITGMDAHFISLFTWASALIALPAVTWGAVPFYRSALGSLMTARVHMDLPISVAIISAYVSDIITTIQGGTQVYFDSITCLIFLLLSARYLQRRALFRSRATTATIWDLFPSTVRVLIDSALVDRTLSEVKTGDIVQVRSEERIPCDGVVESGHSSINTSFLTGESRPVEVEPGDEVNGGALNMDGTLCVRVTETGGRTRLGKILGAVHSTQSAMSEVEGRANRFSGYFSLGVIGVSALTFLYWYFVEPARALPITISLLVITCPCALGLAIPATVAVALRQARNQGFFISHGETIHTLARCKRFFFDKTGTISTGVLKVTEMEGAKEHLRLVHALASVSSPHPVTRALIEFSSKTPPLQLKESRTISGSGVVGVTEDSTEIALGSYRWFQSREIPCEPNIQEAVDRWLTSGMTVSLFESQGRCVAAFALVDVVRSESRSVIQTIRDFGGSVELLSGDAQEITASAALSLGLPASAGKGNLYPEEKEEILSKEAELTVFVGDGLNDAPALRKASVGIALRGGIEAAVEVADIFVSKGSIEHVSSLIIGAHKVKEAIARNLAFSVLYNIIVTAIAVTGHATPLMAAILMPLSSAVVIISSAVPNYFNARREASWR